MKDIRNIIILILVAVIVYLTQCNRPDETPQQIVIKDTTIYVPEYLTIYGTDTIFKDVPLPYEVERIVTRYDTIEVYHVDTANLILDYFYKRVYNDTIKLDSLGFLVIKDTIQTNRILSRRVIRNINFKVKPLTVRSNRWYWGLSLLGNTQEFNAITADLLWVQPNNAYSLGVGTDGTDWIFKGSIYFRF